MKMADFWTVTPWSLANVYRRFKTAWCLRHQGDETTRYIPEDIHLHAPPSENLKSHKIALISSPPVGLMIDFMEQNRS